MKKDNKQKIIEILTSISKQRGFVFQSSEIYGGLGSTWDYGPLGIELKRNVKNLWWKSMVTARDNIVGMDAAILMHPDVWTSFANLFGPNLRRASSKRISLKSDARYEDRKRRVVEEIIKECG